MTGQKGLQKPLELVKIAPPREDQRAKRNADFAKPGEKRGRYHMPNGLESGSPVGYRTRIPLTEEEAQQALQLLSLERPTGFAKVTKLTEEDLFEECSLGVLSARQSTNFRGYHQVTLGPDQSEVLAGILEDAKHLDAPVLHGASYTHVVFARPYRTPFTTLLTFIGHKPVKSMLTVPLRGLRKRVFHEDDIPSVASLVDLHVGILADAMERAALIASGGKRMANIIMAPFCDAQRRKENKDIHDTLCQLAGFSREEARAGWRIALIAQVGKAKDGEAPAISKSVYRKMGGNLMAFRSERIQPGVNQEPKAPASYQTRQDMNVPPNFTVQAGRAGYNAFAHWTGVDRERAKELMLLERVDVLTDGGKERLRRIRDHLSKVTDKIVGNIPLWADLPLGRALSRNAMRGKKAFALAGQRIYILGLSEKEIAKEGMNWCLAVRAVGAGASRAALFAEIMGVTELPRGCDLLAGICLMAGPVNQSDIGKQFYGMPDLLAEPFGDRDPTALLVWTLKAKTVADPIGNEQQLLDPKRKGALVDLRPAPHEVCDIKVGGRRYPLRSATGETSKERAFADMHNFVVSPSGKDIPGNEGIPWPRYRRSLKLWQD